MTAPIRCFLLKPVDADAESGDARIWRRSDTGEETTIARAPSGAIWEAPWMGDRYRVNGTGPVLVIKLPDGRDFMPGSVAANCPRKHEDHDCWCVHGEAPDLTFDKNPAEGRTTCNAGAGSIGPARVGGWHGFVRDGYLVAV